MKITLQTSGDTPQVSVFATDNPPRIVLDLSDTENNAGSDTVRVGSGAVQQYSAVGAGGRTRLVVDLTESVAYDYSADGGQVVLMVGGGSQAAAQSGSNTTVSGPAVTGVDFRLGVVEQTAVVRLVVVGLQHGRGVGAEITVQEDAATDARQVK